MIQFIQSDVVAALLIRLLVGVWLVLEGYPRFIHRDKQRAFAQDLGLPAPQVFAHCMGIVPLFGGVAIALGFLTQGAAVLTLCFSGILLYDAHVKHKKTFLGGTDRYFFVFVLAFSLIFLRPGAWSLDWYLFR